MTVFQGVKDIERNDFIGASVEHVTKSVKISGFNESGKGSGRGQKNEGLNTMNTRIRRRKKREREREREMKYIEQKTPFVSNIVESGSTCLLTAQKIQN